MNETNCCRTCLSKSDLKPIFQYPDQCKKYTFLLYLATGLKIHIKDNLSQVMCVACINNINEHITFRQRCQRTHFKLQTEMINHDTESNINKKINESVNNDSANENYLHHDDNEFDETNDNTDSNKVKIENEPFVKFKMTVGEVLKKRTNIEFINFKHKKKVHLKYDNAVAVVKKPVIPDVKQDIGPVECIYCHKIFKSRTSLTSHYKIHKGRNIICEHCGRKFFSKRQLIVHCKSKHGYEKTDKCSYCDYRGCNAELVKIHERLHTGERPYVCSLCGAAFYRRSTYLQHVPIHLPNKTVPCPECPALFKSVTLMRIHRSRHRKRRARELTRTENYTRASQG